MWLSEFRQSEDYLGTGEIQLIEGWSPDQQITITPIPPIGYGTVNIDHAVAGSFTYTNPITLEQKTRSVSAAAAYVAVSGYTSPTATFTGTISSSYSESAKLDPPFDSNSDNVGGSVSITFDLKKKATVAASWSCGGEFIYRSTPELRLTRISGGTVQNLQRRDARVPVQRPPGAGPICLLCKLDSPLRD